jgi:hypothetical protein
VDLPASVSVTPRPSALKAVAGKGLMARLKGKVIAEEEEDEDYTPEVLGPAPASAARLADLREKLAMAKLAVAAEVSTPPVRPARVQTPAKKDRSLLELLGDKRAAAELDHGSEEALEQLLRPPAASSSSSAPAQASSKKKKKKKKKKKAASSTSSSDEEGSSASEQLFRDAPHRTGSLASRLTHLAKHHPGRLMRRTLQMMQSHISPGTPLRGTISKGVAPIAMKYLQQVLRSQSLDGRNLKELSTLARAVDLVIEGSLEQACELLLQRFKAVEGMASGTLRGDQASHLELLPPLTSSSMAPEEQDEVTGLAVRWDKVKARRGWPPPARRE